MSDIPSLPALPATASATGSADVTANGHRASADLAATQDAASAGMTASGDGYSAGAGAHASPDGASAQASANGHGVSGDARVDTAADLPDAQGVLDTVHDKLAELGGNVSGALDVGATAIVNEVVNVVLTLRAMFEGALPF